ncbi:hypothetical protein HMH01_09555 [Halovulum dunhuangense]|uniref:Endonuclease/exonuclease/phosphatase domain-containing protein n=1 Tax=Halovulum dunhuangense TaxID=1505036 RepID=A0A849L375_9RHOB|nr:endonuclease/exonuclease/phosphatase family protein [Halovulum dunhuangense]NNU80680.1 hypothetical protein [Halovulum dunhuangense]
MLDAIRGLTTAIATAGIVAVIAGYFGDRHPALDTLGAFRLHALVAFGALFAFALVFRAMTARFIALTGAMLAAAGLAPAVLPADPIGPPELTLFSQNLRFDNPTPQAVVAGVEAARADIVAFQEVSRPNRAILDALRYPTQVLCEFAGVGDVALLSRHPMIGSPGCARGQGVAWARLSTPAGEVTAVTLHLPWPWPHTQAAQSERVAGILAELEEPVVIAGDFNIPAWGASLKRIAESTGTRAVPGLRLTFLRPAFWPGLPLDHVLVSEELLAETRMIDAFGSDHAALLTGLRFR